MGDVFRRFFILLIVVSMFLLSTNTAYANENEEYLCIEVDGLIFTSGAYTTDEKYYR